MKADCIMIEHAVMHVLDTDSNNYLVSNEEIDMGSNLHEFFKKHIEKITSRDHMKNCLFYSDSEIGKSIKHSNIDFLSLSKMISQRFYEIMNVNIDIPAADLAFLLFRYEGEKYLGMLKLNYKPSYTHISQEGVIDIIVNDTILPGGNTSLTEAILINMDNLNIQLLEKRYEVNGMKVTYISKHILDCYAPPSPKQQVDLLSKTAEKISKNYYGEDIEIELQLHKKIVQEFSEKGELHIGPFLEKIFPEEDMRNELGEKIEKYGLNTDTKICLQSRTIEKLSMKKLVTDHGIEIKIPLDLYEQILEINHKDNGITISIKEIGQVKMKNS